jgi:hypothetical protein
MEIPGTSIAWELTGTPQNNGTYANGSSSPLTSNGDYTSTKPQVILNDENLTNTSGMTTSLRLVGTLTTDGVANHLSPAVDMDRTSIITICNRVDYSSTSTTDELHSYNGPALAKYITKNVMLDEESNSLNIWMDIHRPTDSHVDIYVKTGNDTSTIDTASSWVRVDPELSGTSSSNQYTGTGTIPHTDEEGAFIESGFVYSATEAFTVFSVKVVMQSTNTSRPPMIRNFRAITAI